MKESRWQTLSISGKVDVITIMDSKVEIARGPSSQSFMADRYGVFLMGSTTI